ncbi:Sulfotransferase domain-containing protein [Desulfatibacillum alkenivorans DSM 16219]|uniref:Sulfotransferase domain-containing protein n=1 Tax=Desulfatibacillum alkenivorans DSM 16219 TaxID=1121393 RepID=A0A1M6PX04_9BACT|nr:sulfotransferase [Desulfatibacillum alkenivorans]SHK12505.1 Sulfotransferase domain-containing protein [Desulfatibacillum alkenivorans DSM 16219]
MGDNQINFQTIPMHGNRRSVGCDETREKILDNMVIVGGPYRGGTTILTDFINSHEEICVVSDFLEREHTSIFYFAGQTGLCAYVKNPELSQYTARGIIANGVFDGEHVVGLTKILGNGFKNERFTYRGDKRFVINDLGRYTLPIEHFHQRHRLAMKHPEVAYCFPRLAGVLDKAKILLTYRPMQYVVRSWVRATTSKPGTWADLFDVWLDDEGKKALPVHVPHDLKDAWQDYNVFQRIVCFNNELYKAFLKGVRTLDRDRFLLLHHQNLVEHPDLHRKAICSFIGISDRSRSMFEFQKKFLRNRNKEISFTDEQNAQAKEVLGVSMQEAQEAFEEEFVKELTVVPRKLATTTPKEPPKAMVTPMLFQQSA